MTVVELALDGLTAWANMGTLAFQLPGGQTDQFWRVQHNVRCGREEENNCLRFQMT